MGEIKHTPGPWEVIPYGDGDSLVIHSGRDWRVCFMATPGESPGAMAMIEANASLIAAAPDLLAAAKIGLAALIEDRRMTIESETVPRVGTLEPDLSTLDEEAADYVGRLDENIAQVTAAIAKAEGRA